MGVRPAGIHIPRVRGVLWAVALLAGGAVGCARADRAPRAAESAVATLDTMSPPVLRVERDSVAPTSGAGAVPSSGGAAASDTARGILRTVGAAPLTHMVLAPANGEQLALASGDSAVMIALAAADGLEIMISGERTAERVMDVAPSGTRLFRVRHFTVRAADGVSARDGLLRRVDGAWYLETAPGVRQPIVSLPAALRNQEGARVFLVGDPTRAPQAFGVLQAR
jgi:uncharacterized Zn-binding protein involved in type VI secretion